MNKLIYFDRAFEHLLTITKGLTDTTQDFYQAFQTAGDSANSTQQSTYSFCRTVFCQPPTYYIRFLQKSIPKVQKMAEQCK